MRGFFENGGHCCFVIPLGDDTPAELERGLEVAETLNQIDLVCAPDLVRHPPDLAIALQALVLEHCDRMGDRFAILDGARAATAYREGTDKQLSSRQIAGLNTYGNITLKRGITDNDELWKWQKEVLDGETKRQNVSIILANDKGEETLRWNLEKCWPVHWVAPEFNATSGEVAIETLELVHEGVTTG